MRFLIFLLTSFSCCLSPFAMPYLSLISLLILSPPFSAFSLSLSCDLVMSPALFVFSFALGPHFDCVLVKVSQSLSASAFSFHLFIVLLFGFLSFIFSHAQWKVTVNMFESLSASAFYFHFFVFLAFAHCLFFMTTHSHPFTSAFDLHQTTAHSRCDEFFCQPFVRELFEFGLNVLILVVFERSICTCSDHYLSVN